MTYRFVTSAFIAALLTASAAVASPEIPEQTQAQVREKLTAEGYDVRRIDSEDGLIEVYALKDGKKLELYLDESLKIVRSKSDD
ncbi:MULTISPECIES: PepSY domain-containing protein [Roseobacteraceae]|uniref:PepSY domain-containing protein n=1 Tax=Roseobacteraceae TaxID=2854170 RepID=UPI0013B5CB22|nr:MULTISPECIES: PepSY domain-containing protein [Roseobacteraceae]MCA0996445.1 PepSY domain-containing protein [Alloyangia pacifica]NDV98132.1 PepSY domain-containing protein [Salipiger sp. PrR002]NDW57107.1 PepSY domain-containing protein [Salipiger sp. PrR004]